MNGSMKMLTWVGAAAMLAACGVETSPSGVRAQLELPTTREARIAITPALDVSGLYDARIADRISLEEVTINLADARLLGPDARIPAGGLDLLDAAALISAYGGDELGLTLPFPEYLLSERDLAVYVRIDPSADLDGASVIIRGRLYEHALAGGQSPLTVAPDPDGDPADEMNAKASARPRSISKRDDSSSIDPDGDPAHPCSPDPDGDPALPSCARRALIARSQDQRSAPFELRGADAADLVARLGGDSSLDVVIGVPASKWFTPETMATLDRALTSARATSETGKATESDRAQPIVLQPRKQSEGQDRVSGNAESGYFLSDDPALGGLKVHRDE